MHEKPSRDDARRGRDALLEVVADFPFESPEHRSAWLASLLTPLARFAFEGPSPLFLIDANTSGAGKTLLVQTGARIVLGHEIPAGGYAHDADETRKKITSVAIAGDRMVLLDNIEGKFGNDALARALTCTRWQDRLLGLNKEIDLPMTAAWYATGNNVQPMGDTLRRILHVRLNATCEKPEERTGFRHPQLLVWVGKHRARLLTAGLTILSAYIRRGMPSQGLTPFGSFDGWSALVRSAVVWVGEPDPCLTRAKLAAAVDTSREELSQVMIAWEALYPPGRGVQLSRLMDDLYSGGTLSKRQTELRLALETFAGSSGGKAPSAREIGYKLRGVKRRIIRGRFFDAKPGASRRGGVSWALHPPVDALETGGSSSSDAHGG